MNRRRHFQRFGRGVFTCCVCERRTRQVDQGADSELCPECWELAGWDNHHNDNAVAPTADEMKFYESLLAKAVKGGGNAERMRKNFSFIWSSKPEAA